MSKKENNVAEIVTKLISPVVERLGLLLWDVEFKKEGSAWILRVFIDKKDGVLIEDCENTSREIDSLLDEADIVSQSYYLEVSSPGIERELKKDFHFSYYIGERIYIKLYKAKIDIKEFVCVLKSFSDNRLTVLLDNNDEMVLETGECAQIKLYYDFNK